MQVANSVVELGNVVDTVANKMEMVKHSKGEPKVKEKNEEVIGALDFVDEDGQGLTLPPSHAMELTLEDEIDQSGFSLLSGLPSADNSVTFGQNKKARLSQASASSTDQISTSPDLHHKQSKGPRQTQAVSAEDDGGQVHTNMFGVNYVMWFDVSIEGKDPMDPAEQDWGGRVEFGFADESFPKDVEDYFLLFEDECTTQSHSCAGRVMGVLFDMRDKVLKPPGAQEI